jgi:hypothetical protein
LQLFVSGQVTPHAVFLPLLGAAAAAGVNPNLGKAKEARLDVRQLVQVSAATNMSSSRFKVCLLEGMRCARGQRVQACNNRC